MTKYNKSSYKSKSAEERKQEIDNAMQLVEQGVKEFLTSEKYAAVLKSISKFHNYSFNNTMLIMMQCPAASYVASYPSWKKNFNRFVTGGSKGIKIFVPVEYKIYQDKVDPETKEPIVDDKGNPIKEYSGQKGLSFKIGNVFDISQTQQIEGKEIIPLDFGIDELNDKVSNYRELLKAVVDVAPVPVDFSEISNGAKGYFSPAENKIVLQFGMSELQTLKTAIHETAHAILHNTDKLKALKQENIEFSREDKETQAESVAFTVAYHYGLDTSDYSFPYVASWAGDSEKINANMKYISEAADQIIVGMDKSLELSLSKGKDKSKELLIEADNELEK